MVGTAEEEGLPPPPGDPVFLPIVSLGLFLGSLGFVFLVERDTVPFGSSDETRRRSPRIVRGLCSLDGGSHLRIWGVEDGTCLLDPHHTRPLCPTPCFQEACG